MRSLLRRPATSVPAVLLIALAVGVSTGLYAYFSSLVAPRLDAPDASRLVSVWVGSKEEPRAPASYRELELLQAQGAPVGRKASAASALSQVAGYAVFGASLGDQGQTRFG